MGRGVIVMTLGQRIQQIRIEHGLSQEQFAEKLGTTRQTVYVMTAIAAILAILTIYNDIRLAGFAWGSLAVVLQFVFALSFVFLIFFALIGFVMKKLFNIHSSLLTSIFGGLGIKGELLLLLHFLHP